MEEKPAGHADFFSTLHRKLVKISDDDEILGKFTFREGTSEYQAASRRQAERPKCVKHDAGLSVEGRQPELAYNGFVCIHAYAWVVRKAVSYTVV